MAWCASCAEQVSMLTPEEVAAISGVSSRTVYRWIEASSVHFLELPNETVYVCLKSLSAGSAIVNLDLPTNFQKEEK